MEDRGGWEALAEAVRTGDAASVRHLVTDDPGLMAAHARSGESAVLLAVYCGQDEVAQWLVAAGAPIDLHEAAALGLSDRVTAQLVARPEAVNAYSFDGWTPLHLAAFFGRMATVEVLLAAGAGADMLSHNEQANLPLHAATVARRVDVVTVLLRHGCDVNARTASGWTPLHLAAHGGYAKMIDLLVERGAALGPRNAEGATPTDLADQQGRTEVAARLRTLCDNRRSEGAG